MCIRDRDVTGFPRREDLTGGEFGRLTFSIWEVPVNGRDPWQKACKHPAPWPLALARRLVRLYTAPGMTVLDPWAGSGTSCAAALSEGCHAVGYDLSAPYLEAARAWCSETLGEYYRPRPDVIERTAPSLPLLALAGAAPKVFEPVAPNVFDQVPVNVFHEVPHAFCNL